MPRFTENAERCRSPVALGHEVRSNRLQYRTDCERYGGRGQTAAEGRAFTEEVSLDELHTVPARDVLCDGGYPLPQGACVRIGACCAMNASAGRPSPVLSASRGAIQWESTRASSDGYAQR